MTVEVLAEGGHDLIGQKSYGFPVIGAQLGQGNLIVAQIGGDVAKLDNLFDHFLRLADHVTGPHHVLVHDSGGFCDAGSCLQTFLEL